MKKTQTLLLIVLIIILILIVCGLIVYPVLKPDTEINCGDGFCGNQENWKNCPEDCEKPIKPFCGDNVCEEKEVGVCLTDCPSDGYCGDGLCDTIDESCETCSKDCGECPAVSRESHFGVHFLTLDYDSALGYIKELGEQIFIRSGEAFSDILGWKIVKNKKESIDLCKSCCNPDKSACNCNIGDMYYCEPENRNILLETPITTNFYNNNFNLFGNLYNTGGYGDKPPKNIIVFDYPHNNEDLYRDYISIYVQEFGDKIKYWQVGNENEVSRFWSGTPQEYANLLVISSEEIRKNCADCKVGISFAHPNVSSSDWYTAIGNVCGSFDFIDAHYYSPLFIEEGTLDRWKTTCPGKEFISTETGVLDNIGNKPQNAGGNMMKQAQDLVKYNTLLFAEGYNQIYFYLIDFDWMPDLDDDPWEHFGLIDEVDNSRKPAFYSYKTMIEKVDYFASIRKLAEGKYKYTFSNKNPVYILWCDSGTCSIPKEISGQVTVTDYLGNEEIKDASDIVLSESPIFVE